MDEAAHKAHEQASRGYNDTFQQIYFGAFYDAFIEAFEETRDARLSESDENISGAGP
jgi:hypothetical protein